MEVTDKLGQSPAAARAEDVLPVKEYRAVKVGFCHGISFANTESVAIVAHMPRMKVHM